MNQTQGIGRKNQLENTFYDLTLHLLIVYLAFFHI